MKNFLVTYNVVDGEHEFISRFSIEAKTLKSATNKANKIAKTENSGKGEAWYLHDYYTQQMEILSVVEVTGNELNVLSKFNVI